MIEVTRDWLASHGATMEPSVDGDWYCVPVSELARHGEYVAFHFATADDNDQPTRPDAAQIMMEGEG